MARQQLDIGVQEEGEITIVTLRGGVDAFTVQHFQRTLDELASIAGVTVVLDCRNLSYMNSASFALLNKYHRICEDNQGYFAICGLQYKIGKLIELLGLHTTLHIYERRKNALDAIKKNA